jgi:hypothetical protein
MNPDRDGRTLQLVYSRNRRGIEASRFQSDEVGTQGTLFPSIKPGVAVFVRFPSVEGDEFAEVLRMAQPSYVFDLRIAPRFDVGSLNRRAAFAIFDEVNATYFDATAPLMMGEQREIAIERFKEAIAKNDFQRPLVFLFGSGKGSFISDKEVLSILASAGKPASDLVDFPPK